MARTIESPGVEIREVDLSLRTQTPVGTKVLMHGFASQGPTNELIQVSTKDELDQIFFGGVGPTNAAERYFYHSAREVLNSPATLMVTRLPYGSGDGTGFNGEYTALAYGANTDTIYTITNETSSASFLVAPLCATSEVFNSYSLAHSGINAGTVSLTLNRYVSTASVPSYTLLNSVAVVDNGNNLLTDTISNPTVSGSINYTTGSLTLSSYVSNGANAMNLSSVLVANYRYTNANTNMFSSDNSVRLSAPVVVTLTESQYNDIKAGQITWNVNASGSAITGFETLGNAAFFVVNDAKTTINETYEGYYLALADNSTVLAAGYDTVSQVKTLSSNNTLRNLSQTTLGFSLTGTDTINPGNISEIVETSNNFDFTDAYFNDSLVMYLFRLRTSVYATDPTKLYYAPVEKFVGSLESGDQRASPINGQMQSWYLADKVNNASNYIQMFVNPNLANAGLVEQLTNGSKTLNPIGSYTPCKASNSSLKYIGNVPSKVERALALAENIQLMDIDITTDAGLTTVWTYVADDDGETTFDDTKNVATSLSDLANVDLGSTSNFAQYHLTILNLYKNFSENTRKDCVHLSDPIRGIFITGESFKTLDRKDRNFTSNVYTPLKNIYAGVNSNYCATYANWVSLYDNNTNKFIWLPFSGYQAAIMARMDAALQPWYAPMGLNNGRVQNITDIAVRTNQKQQDMLYRIGVNPVVYFQGDGFVVWGQKTLQAKPSAFDRINVRRLFLTMERATLKVLRYFVAEPNTTFTRTRVVNVLKPLFDLAKNNEGMYDYLIVCDERNNTPIVIDNNEMKVDIYIKPVRTAEFILATFYATRTDQDFNELVG